MYDPRATLNTTNAPFVPSASVSLAIPPPCRNILRYGLCKFQVGCEYDHNMKGGSAVGGPSQGLYQGPIGGAPVTMEGFMDRYNDSDDRQSNIGHPSSSGSLLPLNDYFSGHPMYMSNPEYNTYPSGHAVAGSTNDYGGGAPSHNGYVSYPPYLSGPPMPSQGIMPVSGNYKFSPMQGGPSNVANTPYYTGMPHHLEVMSMQYGPSADRLGQPHASTTATRGRSLPNYFVNERLKQELLRRQLACIAEVEEGGERARGLPSIVQQYHSFYPLDDPPNPRGSRVIGMPVTAWRASDSLSGAPVCIRCPVSYSPSSASHSQSASTITSQAISSLSSTITNQLQPWLSLRHPGITGLLDVFVTKEWSGRITSSISNSNDKMAGIVSGVDKIQIMSASSTPFIASASLSLFFVYEFCAAAETLEKKFLQMSQTPLTEAILRSILVQLVVALRAVHSAGLASRAVDVSKILIMGNNRVKLTCGGIMDVVKGHSNKTRSDLQYEDVFHLGKLLLFLACRQSPYSAAPTSAATLPLALDYVVTHYSNDLRMIIMMMVSPPAGHKPPTIFDLCHHLSGPIIQELESASRYTDELESSLGLELENGRLLRLIVKMGWIAERSLESVVGVSESNGSQWSETGDRYPIKLFRDFVFHQVSEDGTPVLDYGHVMESLTKLDHSSDEYVLLVSRDNTTQLVLCYRDVRRCIDNAIRDLMYKKLSLGGYDGANVGGQGWEDGSGGAY